jgi:hypothetical protein
MYDKALAINSRSATAHRGLGVAAMTVFVMDPNRTDARDRALSHWHQSLEIKPDQPDLVKLVDKYTPEAEAAPL